MTRRVLWIVLLALPSTIVAQVGYPPAASPYLDIDTRMRVGVFGGTYFAAKDPAGVMPHSGMIVGARLDLHVGGPADLAFRFGLVPTDRDEIDPTKAASQRIIGTRDLTLTLADVGIVFRLTGGKSWHGIAPALHASVGIASDFAKADSGGYKHGTTFAFGYGASAQFVPRGSRLTYQLQAGSYLYSQEYPTSYYAVAGDGSTVLTSSTPRSSWRNNWTLQAGVSYRVFR